MDWTDLSPFANLATSDLLGTFVGRDEQLSAIRDAFNVGAQGVVIVGSPGSGKSSLARFYASRADDLFPGGIFEASAARFEASDDLFSRLGLSPVSRDSLLILDDAETLDRYSGERLQQLLRQYLSIKVLLTSRRPFDVPGFRTVHLPSALSQREFIELLRRRNAFVHGPVSDQLMDRLYRVAGGNALFANVASAAILDRSVSSWDELLARLHRFETPGLVGPDGNPLDPQSNDYNRIVVDISSVNEELLRLLKRDPEVIWKLPPRRFEEIVAEILTKQGYEVSLTPTSGDGGFDMYAARSDGLGKFLYLVECKRYVPPNKVGVEIVRSLHGVVQAHRATAGVIVTSSFFTGGAETFQREIQHQLQLHDYIVLQNWIKDFPLERLGKA